jgi:hypothetical protein
MAGGATINIGFFANLNQFSTEMQKANRQMVRFGNKMQQTGKGLTAGLTAPIVGLGILSVKTFANFEEAMAKVAAVSGATSLEFNALKENANDLGESTRFAASEVAGLQLNFSKLGFNPAEILAATGATLNLALATGEDLASSATVAAGTLQAFGLDAESTLRIVDVMAKSFSSSALDLEKFKTAMATVGPVAKTAGFSIEETTGFLSVLVNANIDASTAGTGLRNIFLDVAASGESLTGSLDKILNSTNKNKTALELFGKRGATVATVLADNYQAALDFGTSYESAAGSAKKMADIMDNTLLGTFKKLQSSAEGLFIAIGTQLKPMISALTESFTDLISSYKGLSDGTKKTVVAFALIAAAVGPLLVTLGFLMTTVVPGLITVFGALKLALISLQGGFVKLTAIIAANPFGALAVGIAAVISYFVFFNKETEKTIQNQSLLSKVNDVASKSIANEKAKLAELLFIAQNESIVKSARIKAIKELNKLSPKYLGNLTLEKINTDDARIAVAKYNAELLKTARVKAAQSKLQEISSKIIDLQLAKEKQSVAQAKGQLKIQNDVNLSYAQKQTLLSAVNNQTELGIILSANELQNLKDQEKQLLKIIAANQIISSVKKGDSPAAATRKVRTVFDFTSVGIQDVDLDAKAKFGNLTAALEAEKPKILKELNGITAQFSAFDMAANEIISSAATNVVAGFGAMIGGLISGASGIGDFKNVLLGSLGGMLEQLGEIAIQAGIGLLAIKTAFESLNPFVAIAAGIALVAFGGIIKSQVKDVGSNNFAGSFAEGGTVGGSSFSGDKLFARVNSGEMILNNRQQNNLSGLMGGGNRQGVNVVLQPSIDVVGDKFRVLLNKVDQRNLRRK